MWWKEIWGVLEFGSRFWDFGTLGRAVVTAAFQAWMCRQEVFCSIFMWSARFVSIMFFEVQHFSAGVINSTIE